MLTVAMPDDAPQSDQPKKGKAPPWRNTTGEIPRQKWMREKSEEIDRALGIESDTFTPTDNGGFVQQGDGYLIMGMGDDLETTPRPMPPEAELRKAAETPHNYPDLAQPPLRKQFESDAAFDKAMIHWLVNVAPAVVRRHKRFERIQLKPGATANDIVAAIRARATQKVERPAAQPSANTSGSSTPTKSWSGPRNLTATRTGGGSQIIGADSLPTTTPSADSLASGTPPDSRGGIVVSPHPFPEIPQAPTKQEFPDEEEFAERMAGWMHTYGKIVAMRLKYGKPRTENEGPAQTANDKKPPSPAEPKPAVPYAKKLVRFQFQPGATAEQIYEGMQELFRVHLGDSQTDEKSV